MAYMPAPYRNCTDNVRNAITVRNESGPIASRTCAALQAVPLVVYMAHLAIGDTWNYINNVEKRTGVAVPGVLACWAGVAAVVATYFSVSPTAGEVSPTT